MGTYNLETVFSCIYISCPGRGIHPGLKRKDMKKPTLVKDYSKLSETKLDLRSEEIISNLTGNPNFPTTMPSLADFTALQATYSTNLVAAGMGDKAAIALKNQSKQELLDAMRLLAINIESQSMGNRVKMVTSGFDLASEGDNVPVLAAPQNFRLTDGVNAGELRSVVKGVPQAIMYSHEYTLTTPDENTIWIPAMVSSVEYVFTGLPGGTKVYVRVAAVGRKNQVAYSNVLSRVVQ
jgi:hypothetical protein